MKEIIKNKVIEINKLTEGNVIFVGSISSYFNGITNQIKDIDIVLKDKTYFPQLETLGEIKPPNNLQNIFGDNVGRFYIMDDVIIDIFIKQDDIDIKENILEGETIKTRTLDSQIKLYNELLEKPIEKEEYRIKLKNKLIKIYLSQNNFSPKQLDNIHIR